MIDTQWTYPGTNVGPVANGATYAQQLTQPDENQKNGALDWISVAVSAITGAAGSFLNQRQNNNQPAPANVPTVDPPKESNKTLHIVLGVFGFLTLVVITVLIVKSIRE